MLSYLCGFIAKHIRIIRNIIVFSHAFHLNTDDYSVEWMYRLTNGQLDFGEFAVAIFFLCGGYFACMSTLREESFIRMIWNRYRRLAKPLAFVVVCSIVVGLVITSLNIKAYVTSTKSWMYLLNIILIPIHDSPGVFENNIQFTTVNGALWTLPIEFICFIACVCDCS